MFPISAFFHNYYGKIIVELNFCKNNIQTGKYPIFHCINILAIILHVFSLKTCFSVKHSNDKKHHCVIIVVPVLSTVPMLTVSLEK